MSILGNKKQVRLSVALFGGKKPDWTGPENTSGSWSMTGARCVCQFFQSFISPQPCTQWCGSCGDGGDLWPCSQCPRVICSTCIVLPIGAGDLGNPVIQFICPRCHLDREWECEIKNRKEKGVSRETMRQPYTVRCSVDTGHNTVLNAMLFRDSSF